MCGRKLGTKILVLHCHAMKNKSTNHSIQKVSNLGNKRQESGLCNISKARYSEKRSTQIDKALYGNATMATGNQQKHLFLSSSTNG